MHHKYVRKEEYNMAKGKYAAQYAGHYNMKSVALILALALIIGSVVGGTIDWLIATPDPVVNTFTYGDINIELSETDTQLDDDSDPNTNDYKMMPGIKITKDPVVTVKAESEEMWLFVKLEKSSNFDTFMEYTVAADWTALSGVDGVYFQHITAEEVATADKEIAVIKDDTVTVKESVTKEMLNALDAPGTTATYPTLTVTAYAVQYAGNATAADAWAKVTANP
jgi:hypothetical protein